MLLVGQMTVVALVLQKASSQGLDFREVATGLQSGAVMAKV